MSFSFSIHMIALLFSFFVIGAVLGALFTEIFRDRIIAALPPSFLLLLRTFREKTDV